MFFIYWLYMRLKRMLKNIEVRQYENVSIRFVYVDLEHIKGRYISSERDEYDCIDRINEIIVIPGTSQVDSTAESEDNDRNCVNPVSDD